MRALSLTQPWVWIILHLGKRVENRTRNIGNYRGPVALHAAKQPMSIARWLVERDWPELARWYMGAHAYVLDDVREVNPIPCLGALGFWRLPVDVGRRLGRVERNDAAGRRA